MTTVIVIVTRRVSLRPSPLRDITLHTTLNILGVTSTTGLSVVKRVQGVIKVKGKGVYSSSWNSPQNYGTPLVNGITQCYLPPDRGDRPPSPQPDRLVQATNMFTYPPRTQSPVLPRMPPELSTIPFQQWSLPNSVLHLCLVGFFHGWW